MNNALRQLFFKQLPITALIFTIACFIGLATAQLSRFNSPTDAYISLGATIGLFEVLALLLVYVFRRAMTRASYAWAFVRGFGAAVIIFLLSAQAFSDNRVQAIALRELSVSVKDFGLAHFDALDADGNGTITVGELDAFNGEGLSAIDAAMLDYMRKHAEQVGHVSTENRRYIPVAGTEPYSVQVVTYPIVTIGIDKSDLITFPERALGALKDW